MSMDESAGEQRPEGLLRDSVGPEPASMASSPANEVLKSLMPLKNRGLPHPLSGLGRVAKQPSRCGGLLADQVSHRKCPLCSFAGPGDFGSQSGMNGHVVELAEAALQVFQ